MNQINTNSGNNLFLRLHNLFNGESREYFVSFAITLGLFLFLAAGDIIFSYNLNFTSGVFIIPVLLLVYTVYNLQVHVYGKTILLPQLVFFIACFLLCLMYIKDGRLNGSYFYFFPASLAYFCHTVTISNKTKLLHFYIITTLFVTIFLTNFLFFKNVSETEVISSLWFYRLVSAAIVTGLLVKHLLILQDHKTATPLGKKTYYEALFQSYLDAFIVYNKETKEVIDCNKQVLQMFELPSTVTIKGLYISQVMMRYLSGDSPNLDIMMDGLPDNWNGEADFTTHNKHKFHAYVKSMVFAREDAEYQILTIRDITEMQVAERELKISKASVEKAARAKARFLSSMSHELRTPLNGIIGTSNLVLSEPNLPENIKNHINVLRYSSEHMLGIINDILDFSKIDAGKMELRKHPFNLKENMDNLLVSFESQFRNKNISLVANYHPELYKVHVTTDKVKLGQIISNLLSNALKFTLAGKVELNVSIIKANSKKVSLFFEVKDTGIGIEKDKQTEIFQGFAQVHSEDLKRDFGGTGLGLTISDKMVGMFGGKLEVESEVGKGTRFYFSISLPVAEVIIETDEKLNIAEVQKDIRGVKILIVEDNEINASILRSFLKKWNVEIKEASHGIQALELLKYHKFDLVLMDLEMPEMDGYTTTKKIRETNTELPVIAFTAALLENMDALIKDNGFTDYLLKPYRPADLKKKIETYAQRHVDYA